MPLLLNDDSWKTLDFVALSKARLSVSVNLDQKDTVCELAHLIEVSGYLVEFRKEFLTEATPSYRG